MAIFKKKDKNVEKESRPEVRVTHSTVAKIAIKRVLSGVLSVFLLMVVLYAAVAVTIMRFVPVQSDTVNAASFSVAGVNFVPTKNNTYPGGLIPEGGEILIDRANVQNDDLMSKVKKSFTPTRTGAVINVVAGPTGKMKWVEPDILSIDGEVINAPFPPINEESPLENRSDFLTREYVGVCLEGACNPGELVLFNEDKVMGIILKDLKF